MGRMILVYRGPMAHFFAPDRLVTDDFVIRSYVPGDGRALARTLDASYDHLAPWMGWVKPQEDVEDCEARNLASARTAERNGLTLEGTLRGEKADVGEGRRDTLVFGITKG